MELKVKRRPVDTTKSEQGWRQWLEKMPGEPVTLLAEYKELRRHWEAYGRLLDECQRRLEARQNTVESFIQDIEPPSLSLVIDSLLELENIEDHEHAE
ncbi:uncharacterized protein PITG_16781 [Phytophthora infestans T30-4]|uniref:Uncharacterized protein n=1 Tax=Phytophthora infestans (strain T30-4) TaxID=403677 RepID=D0NUV5_PHYIT|nr:uncharacterized protein PITG_16781 [Phytophthora infestans T30-4]EEY65478.1 hypothetical protein PITG_16781 [Phytophthora infestans T30-4]|eukprot:XP_002897107.1 hypothetical protein PITG_16781 [Phytophthora infestans T30-4]